MRVCDKCKFLHTEAGGHPSKKVKERWRKRIGGLVEWTIQLGCVSQDCPQKKSILREVGKLDSNHSQVREGHDASRKNSGKEGSTAGNHSKVRTSGANSVGSKIRVENARRNPESGAVRPQRRLGTGSGCLQTKKEVSCRSLGNAGTLFEKARRARIRERFRSIDVHAEQKGLELRRAGYSQEI